MRKSAIVTVAACALSNIMMAHRATNSTTVRASLRPSEELAAGFIDSKHVHGRKRNGSTLLCKLILALNPSRSYLQTKKMNRTIRTNNLCPTSNLHFAIRTGALAWKNIICRNDFRKRWIPKCATHWQPWAVKHDTQVFGMHEYTNPQYTWHPNQKWRSVYDASANNAFFVY